MPFRERWRPCACLLVMLTLTGAVYLRPAVLAGRETVFGIDYSQLHIIRLGFAEDALFGPRHTLPAWYPHELLGAPFSANLQSFPWIPTRLVLLLLDPEIAYAPGIAMAALLAALFTYLFCWRAGLSEIASAAAGWTFACAGFFASRILPGHLPLLEAYPALPLLLWLADRALDSGSRRRDIAWLAIATTSVVVAGHPQVPAYAVGATLLYVIWRGRGWLRARLAAALVLGSSLALAAWWPMFLLIAKSTRVLALDPPENDIAFPYQRILAMVLPGIDGWPEGVSRAAGHTFSGYPNASYFFDTAAYIGLAPLVAAGALLLLACLRKRMPDVRWTFLAILGSLAFLTALPLFGGLRHFLPGVIFRSPARLLYLPTFSLAAALGAGVDALLAWKIQRTWKFAIVALGLGLHIMDLGSFASLFVTTLPRRAPISQSQIDMLAGMVKNDRLAIDGFFWSMRRYVDDVGTFDSLLLAKPYRAILALDGAPPRTNVQLINGIKLARPALQASGVALVLTRETRPDLQPAGRGPGLNVYVVPDYAPRASFHGAQSVVFLPEEQIFASLRARAYGNDSLLMPPESRNSAVGTHGAGTVSYRRPSSDEIRLDVSADGPGFARVVEAYDPGWTAEVDGKPAPIFAANGFTLASPVPGGRHAVRFLYHTPGRSLGIVLSLGAAGLLALLIGGAVLFDRNGT